MIGTRKKHWGTFSVSPQTQDCVQFSVRNASRDRSKSHLADSRRPPPRGQCVTVVLFSLSLWFVLTHLYSRRKRERERKKAERDQSCWWGRNGKSWLGSTLAKLPYYSPGEADEHFLSEPASVGWTDHLLSLPLLRLFLSVADREKSSKPFYRVVTIANIFYPSQEGAEKTPNVSRWPIWQRFVFDSNWGVVPSSSSSSCCC